MEKQQNQNLLNQQPANNNQDYLNPLINNNNQNRNFDVKKADPKLQNYELDQNLLTDNINPNANGAASSQANIIPNLNLPGNLPYTNLATLAAAAASTVNPLHYQLLLAQLQQAQITQEQNIYNSNFPGTHSGVGNVQVNNNNSTSNGPSQNVSNIQPYTTPYLQQNNNQQNIAGGMNGLGIDYIGPENMMGFQNQFSTTYQQNPMLYPSNPLQRGFN